MLDPLVESWALEAGMPREMLASMLGGNILGSAVKLPLDMFLTDLGSKAVSTLIGGIGLLLGTYTFKGSGRLQMDTMQFGSRMITELIDPSPDQMRSIQRSVGDFVDGWIHGRWDKMVYAFVRNPREITGLAAPQNTVSQPAQAEKPPAPTQKAQVPPGIVERF
jgi:hypothetical protein